ncbi:hypothetical protein ACFOHW_15685 [Paenibacillus abyssi]
MNSLLCLWKLQEDIPENHLVRVINDAVKAWSISAINKWQASD